jgi:hypothetical protein
MAPARAGSAVYGRLRWSAGAAPGPDSVPMATMAVHVRGRVFGRSRAYSPGITL